MGSNRQNASLPEQSPAGFVVHVHPPKLAAVNSRNPVVPGEAFIEEGVVSVDQIERIAILAQDAGEKHLGFPQK